MINRLNGYSSVVFPWLTASFVAFRTSVFLFHFPSVYVESAYSSWSHESTVRMQTMYLRLRQCERTRSPTASAVSRRHTLKLHSPKPLADFPHSYQYQSGTPACRHAKLFLEFSALVSVFHWDRFLKSHLKMPLLGFVALRSSSSLWLECIANAMLWQKGEGFIMLAWV